MKRSDFIHLAVVGGLAAACGATKKKNRQQMAQVDSTKAATGNPYNWKPGDPIHISQVHKTEEEWKKILAPDQYHILREAGTEPAFNNAYWDNHKEGIYFCAGCALPLYSSKTKFESGTGWPSFYQPVDPKVVHKVTDTSAGMVRGEIRCAQCDGHLGHVFNDGPQPTGLRYCMDSLSLHFEPMKV